jgi:hypothetical protein
MITEKEIEALIKDFALSPEDIWRDESKQITIVSRRGILKIIHSAGLNVSKKVKMIGENIVVVTRVSNRIGVHDMFTTATGEASKENCVFKYPVAVAEKRSEARAVLTHIGVYHMGVVGEVELDEETEMNKILAKRASSVDATMKKLMDVVTSELGTKKSLKKNAAK